MILTRLSRTILHGLLGGGAFCIAFSLSSAAQVQTQTSETKGETTKTVTVERGEIVHIAGNDVVVRMEDGTLKDFDNISENVIFMVEGKPVNIHNARVGMKLEKQTIVGSTPRVITTVESVTGTVWHVSPPTSVILRLENGETQTFKIPNGQKFTINGEEKDAWGLKKGMKIQATRVTEVPEILVSREINATGKFPPPPPLPKADLPILVAVLPAPATPTPAPVETAAARPEPVPKKLPKTASDLPLIGLVGALFCALSLTAMTIRRIASRLAS